MRSCTRQIHLEGDLIMNPASRRTFLVATGAGVAAVGVATVAPAVAATDKPAAAAPAAATNGQPLVAYINDAKSGQLTLMVGEREVQVSNPALISQIYAALG
jgi:Rieske Fe-S protein